MPEHPFVITVASGALLWFIQFYIASTNELSAKKTAHYEVILNDKMKVYYQLQTQSNIVLNQIRLLDKLVRYRNNNVNLYFNIEDEISNRYQQFLTEVDKLMMLHYSNYFLQSAESKKAYEDFLSVVVKEIAPSLNDSINLNIKLSKIPTMAIFDIDVSPQIEGF